MGGRKTTGQAAPNNQPPPVPNAQAPAPVPQQTTTTGTQGPGQLTTGGNFVIPPGTGNQQGAQQPPPWVPNN
ncbi:hypothetical protein NMY22_g5154 [Coprinellus aureogranulatus]|nr:hypothetical protein NMY22_g5154 [Coprinellus aureogranulatus]